MSTWHGTDMGEKVEQALDAVPLPFRRKQVVAAAAALLAQIDDNPDVALLEVVTVATALRGDNIVLANRLKREKTERERNMIFQGAVRLVQLMRESDGDVANWKVDPRRKAKLLRQSVALSKELLAECEQAVSE